MRLSPPGHGRFWPFFRKALTLSAIGSKIFWDIQRDARENGAAVVAKLNEDNESALGAGGAAALFGHESAQPRACV